MNLKSYSWFWLCFQRYEVLEMSLSRTVIPLIYTGITFLIIKFMQNTVINSKSVRLWSGVLKVDWIDIGAIDSAGLDATFKVTHLKFKNAQLEPRKKLEDVTLKADMVELDIVKLQKIYWWELTTVAGADNTENAWVDRKILTFDDLINVLDTYEVTFVNTDEDGKQFGVKVLKGYSAGNLAFDFGDDDDLESFSKIPLEFKGLSDSNGKMFEIFDEQGLL